MYFNDIFERKSISKSNEQETMSNEKSDANYLIIAHSSLLIGYSFSSFCLFFTPLLS